MSAIRVVIQADMQDSRWKWVVRALDRQPGIEVLQACFKWRLRQLLKRHRPDVLIVNINDQETGLEESRSFNEVSPHTTFIGLDPKTKRMILEMEDVGLDLLVELIRTAARETHPLEGQPAPQRIEPPPEQPSPQPRSPAGARADDLEQERRWIDLRLHERLSSYDAPGEGTGARGWALSAAQARKLLNPELADTETSKLKALREQHGGQLFGDEGPGSRFAEVCRAFDLSPDERRVLLLCLAPEIDGSYARVFGFLNDNLSRMRPSASLITALLDDADRSVWRLRQSLAGVGRLGRFGLIAFDSKDDLPHSEAALVPANEITSFLLIGRDAPPAYGPLIAVMPAAADREGEHGGGEELTRWLRSEPEGCRAPALQLVGDAATQSWFVRSISARGKAVASLDLLPLVGRRHEQADLESLQRAAASAVRVARLHDAVLLVTGRRSLSEDLRREFDRQVLPEIQTKLPHLAVHGAGAWVTAISGRVLPLERGRLGADERAGIWIRRAQALGVDLHSDQLRHIAATLRFTELEIDAALRLYRPGSGLPGLQRASRYIAGAGVPPSVRRIEACYDWDDIVLPAPVLDQIRSISTHVVHADRVLDDWGYRARMPYGHGVAALFTGSSGCGKTMSAQILARDLGVQLLQVDLSKTVSKYIGETEKNLDAVFDAAERSNAVLLFDEADALFGKRTEVRDAHDRYANVEVAYLLQRMESYCGLAVLTTNFRQNLDEAFTRRLRFIVEFPLPTALDREKIWKLVFPDSAPKAPDLDFAFLARRLELTGGNIQQIAIGAAFAAIDDGGVIRMSHVLLATRQELRRLGRLSEEKMLEAMAA